MNRLLSIVDFWYGEGIRRRVFEPLLADFENDARRDGSILTRARWWGAIGLTFVSCLPRLTFSSLPPALVLDLCARVTVFGIMGFGLQWLIGGRSSQHCPGLWPPSIATTVPMVIIPVIWRIRTADLALYQRRLLAITMAAAFALLGVVSSQGWPLAVANAIGSAFLARMAWVSGDPARARQYPSTQEWWFRIVGPAAAIMVATWPIKIALGIRFLDSLGSYQLVAYGAGALIALSTRPTDRAAASQNR